jgi:DNA repair protein SbcD/Mre11
VKFLHTSDWHVGRAIRGRSRINEHREALAEIVQIARDEQVDAVLVAGDQFDTPAPSPEAEQAVYAALKQLADDGAHVIVIAGNHDNPHRHDAIAGLASANRIHVSGHITRPDQGGVVTIPSRDGTDEAKIALLPFVSQRAIVKASDLMDKDEYEHTGQYGERVARITKALTDAAFSPDTVNLVMGHLTVVSGEQPVTGGGERNAHVAFDYFVSPQVFPASAQYVALGHLHKQHRVPGPAPTFYCGSPLHMDFGDKGERYVLLVDAVPGQPADVTPVQLTAGRPLVTVKGTLDEVEAQADDVDDNAWVRVIVTENPRPGLADEVRQILPDAVAIYIEPPDGDTRETSGWDLSDIPTKPAELFSDYLKERGVEDKAVAALFDEIVEQYHDTADATE